MKNLLLKSVVISSAVVAGVLTFNVGSVQAAECTINPTVSGVSGIDLKNKSIVLNKNKVDVSVTVTGDADCVKSASVATWKWPNRWGLPLKDQILYKTATGTFGPGVHTLSVEVPGCYWQADLVEGTRPTAADGTADYQIGEPNDKTDRLMDAAFGGDKDCNTGTVAPVEPKPVQVSNTANVKSFPSVGPSLTLPIATLFASGLGAGLYSTMRNIVQKRR